MVPQLATASNPQIPQVPWAEIAPTGSSIFILSRVTIENTTISPPIIPMIVARPGVGARGSAVIETKPPIAPFKAIVRSVFL